MSIHPHASRTARCLSELLGTYLLVLIGPGTVAAVSLAQGITTFEALLIIGFAFGATAALVVLLLGRISGAHINPAITLAHTIAGKTRLEMLVPYISFQVLGAILGGFTLKFIFGQFGSPADLGTTKLASGVSPSVGALLETAGTFVLAMSGFLASLRVHKKPGEAHRIDSIRHYYRAGSANECVAESGSKPRSGASVRIFDQSLRLLDRTVSRGFNCRTRFQILRAIQAWSRVPYCLSVLRTRDEARWPKPSPESMD